MAEHGRRSGDHGWRRLVRENWYRDVWLLLTTLIAVIGIAVAVSGSDKANVAVKRQQEGRRVVIGVTCATLSAVSQAGYDVIVTSASAVPPSRERALERLGFPPLEVRRRQALQGASAYVRSISEAVDRQVGRRGDRLVRKNGTLDCRELERLSAARR